MRILNLQEIKNAKRQEFLIFIAVLVVIICKYQMVAYEYPPGRYAFTKECTSNFKVLYACLMRTLLLI